MNRPPTPSRIRRVRAAAAFTLVELMISIALVLVLILGINQVFSITSQGVAGGQALSTAIRDNRSAHAVFFDDLRNIVMPRNASGGTFDEGPAFLIRSERVDAYRNRADHLGDISGGASESPTSLDIRSRDYDDDNVEGPDETTAPAIYNDRSHRVDRLLFFARDQYRRQTGGTADGGDVDPYVAPMSSTEAYFWYGHLQQPDIGAPLGASDLEEFEHRGPGEAPYSANRDNAYSSSWVLGRVVLTMREPLVTEDNVWMIADDNGTPQDYINRPAYGDTGYFDTLRPFVPGSPSTGDGYEVQWHRYDLAGTTLSEFRDVLGGYPSNPLLPNDDDGPLPWFVEMSNMRFQGDTRPPRPLDSRRLARVAPGFLTGCSQFIVEFAGDFVTQENEQVTDPDNNGSFTRNERFGLVLGHNPPVPDGVTDFVVLFEDDNGNGLVDTDDEEATVRRVTRWYGMPRDTNGDSRIPSWAASQRLTNNMIPDVVPLRDIVSSGINQEYVAPRGHRIEQITRTGNVHLDYAEDYADAVDGMQPTARYIAAWGPDTFLAPKPRMIRFTIALDEPGASMANEQTYEYVIELP